MNIRNTRIAPLALFLTGLILPFAASAGVNATQSSATAPDYVGFQLSTVVIRFDIDDADANAVLGHRLVNEFKKRGVTAYLYDDLFTTAEAWTDERMRRVHEELSIDGIMLVDVTTLADGSASDHSHRVRYSATSMPTRSDQPSGRYGGGAPGAVRIHRKR